MCIQMLRLLQVMAKTGLSRAAVWAKQNPKDSRYDASFPKGVKLAAHTTAWVESELDAWLENRLAASRAIQHTSKGAVA